MPDRFSSPSPREDASLLAGKLTPAGPAGELDFLLSQTDDLWFQILPSLQVIEALNLRQLSYTPAHAVCGEMAHLDAFMARVEDHIADVLADVVAVSPASDLLGPALSGVVDFGKLTRF